MKEKPVLIVDDERNIRLTLTQCIDAMGLVTDTAVNGEEALQKLGEKDFGLMLLDLKMPGMDGMEVLRWIAENRPEVRIIIITAYGTIESAVEAMKLGAVDYLQKPFVPEEIRELVSRVIDREKLDAEKARDYSSHVELAKRCIADRHFGAAVEHARHAVSVDPSRPEAFNLLGALLEVQGETAEAQKNYRAALSLDPTYEPARKNLERWTKYTPRGGITLGDADEKKERGEE